MNPHTRRPGATPWLMAAALLTLVAPAGAGAQDANILFPPDSLEQWLRYADFEVVDSRPSRGLPGERTSRSALQFDNGQMLVVKWAVAPEDGEAYNNNPRYEVGAYELQKLFLEPHEYVVPPTVMRAFDLAWIRTLEPDVYPTFDDTESVLVVLQYWLFNIGGDQVWDADRFEADTVYAHHLANFNIFTYLAHHNDQNQGNYLISGMEDSPRIFSVDNGIAFNASMSDQGARWRTVRVDRLPRATVERLRALTEAEVRAHLETLAQFRIEPDGTLTQEPPGPATDPGRGIRRTDTTLQLGLTGREIDDVWRRIQRLLGRVDDGDYQLF